MSGEVIFIGHYVMDVDLGLTIKVFDDRMFLMAVTSEGLISFLKQSSLADLGDVDANTPLFSSRLVDSYAMVELMAFIEQEAGFRVAPFEVSMENFDTIGSILRFVESRVSTAVGK